MFFVWFLFFVYIITINCQNNVLTLTDQQRQAMLDKHNQYRKDCANGVYTINGPQYSSNMVYLFWDKGLEEMARKRASYCYFGHFGGSQGIRDDWDENKENITFFEPRSGYTVGENVAVYAQNPPVTNYPEEIFTSGINGWAEEGELYDWDQNICYADTCGHWGQVCSGPTRYVGCAFVECYDGIAAATLDIYKNGGMLLVCNYYPGVNQGAYPYEDGLTFDFCIRCQQWDVKICEENVCKGGKARDWLASGLINSTIDQCTDGLGRIMDPCTTIDPTKAPSQGLSSSPTKVTDSPITRSPTTSKQPTPRPTLFGATGEPTSVTPPPTIAETVPPTKSSKAPTSKPTPNTLLPTTESPTKLTLEPTTETPSRSTTLSPTKSTNSPTTSSPTKSTNSPTKLTLEPTTNHTQASETPIPDNLKQRKGSGAIAAIIVVLLLLIIIIVLFLLYKKGIISLDKETSNNTTYNANPTTNTGISKDVERRTSYSNLSDNADREGAVHNSGGDFDTLPKKQKSKGRNKFKNTLALPRPKSRHKVNSASTSEMDPEILNVVQKDRNNLSSLPETNENYVPDVSDNDASYNANEYYNDNTNYDYNYNDTNYYDDNNTDIGPGYNNNSGVVPPPNPYQINKSSGIGLPKPNTTSSGLPKANNNKTSSGLPKVSKNINNNNKKKKSNKKKSNKRSKLSSKIAMFEQK